MSRIKKREKVNLFKVIEESTREIPQREKEWIKAEDTFRMNIALAMVKIREALGLSQKELAERLGVTQSWASRLEDANYDHRIESIWKYLKALGAQLDLNITYRKQRRNIVLTVSDTIRYEEEFESVGIYKHKLELNKPLKSSEYERGYCTAA